MPVVERGPEKRSLNLKKQKIAKQSCKSEKWVACRRQSWETDACKGKVKKHGSAKQSQKNIGLQSKVENQKKARQSFFFTCSLPQFLFVKKNSHSIKFLCKRRKMGGWDVWITSNC